jgi:2-haloacid dehalogenase
MQRDLANYRVLTFDCYGTLIDWESGILSALAPWRIRTGIAATDKDLLADFGLHESAQEAATPTALYPEILANVLRRFGDQYGAPVSDAEAMAFARSIPDWPAFDDSGPALRELQEHFALVVLSNVDRVSFAASEARLGVKFDAVHTAQDIGSYKPDPRNFEYLLARLGEQGYARDDVLHVAQSLYHDHVPAQRMGLATCWIDRNAGRPGATKTPDDGVRFDFIFNSLKEFSESMTEGLKRG